MYWNPRQQSAQRALSYGDMKYQELHGSEPIALIKGWADTVRWQLRAKHII